MNRTHNSAGRIYSSKDVDNMVSKLKRTDKGRFVVDVWDLSFSDEQTYKEFVKESIQKGLTITYTICNYSNKEYNIFDPYPSFVEVEKTEEGQKNYMNKHNAFDKTVIPLLEKSFKSDNDKKTILVLDKAFKKKESSK